MPRRACLAIGVSTVAEPDPNRRLRFGYLNGAVLAAEAIGAWAVESFGKANVQIVVDEVKVDEVNRESRPVTQAIVQQAVNDLFPAGADTVEHLVVAFCGHGLTDANVGVISWLFSDAQSQRYRVLATEFCEELFRNGVQRITLISDACREAPKELDLMRYEARRGITVLTEGRVESPRFDKLAACQDGKLGYMVSDRAAQALPGKCVFSGVIADALWGVEPTAIGDDGKITTTTLSLCVEPRTAQRAKDYKLTLNPQCTVHAAAAVLYDTHLPLPQPPPLQPWPAAAAATILGATPAAITRTVSRAIREAGPALDLSVHFGAAGVLASLGAGPGTPSAGQLLDLLGEARRPGVPKRTQIRAATQRVSSAAKAEARKREAGGVRNALKGAKPAVVADDDNLVVSGGDVRIWSGLDVRAGRKTAANISFGARRDPNGQPVLVEFADGAFVPVVPYAQLFAAVKRPASGDAYVAYGRRDPGRVFDDALDTITRFAAGQLAPGDVDQLAARLRQEKHTDPAMGAICAHLYRAVADVDSIRRMAFFYADAGQPVPFDIALLGDMRVTADAEWGLRLHIPAVKGRELQPGAPAVPHFVTNPTTARQARIGGRCPWLGLGWDYVGLVREKTQPLVAGLAGHAPKVARSGFTVLPRTTGRALARLWGLKAR